MTLEKSKMREAPRRISSLVTARPVAQAQCAIEKVPAEPAKNYLIV